MRTSSWLLSTPILLACTLAIAAPPAPPKPPNDLPPPPGINDPGVSSPQPAQAPASNAPVEELIQDSDQDPLAPLPKPDTRPVRDKSERGDSAERMAASDVTKRTQGNDTVEEYRQNGRVWMIRIVQPSGATQTFTDPNGSGRLARDPQEGPVSPVYYSLYEWN